MLRAVVSRPFHTWAAATGKALSPMVDRRVRRTTIDDDAERRRRRALKSADWQSSSARYDGATPCEHLYARTASLKSIRSAVLSQCSWRRSVAMWSYFDKENTSRAVEFITDWSPRQIRALSSVMQSSRSWLGSRHVSRQVSSVLQSCLCPELSPVSACLVK